MNLKKITLGEYSQLAEVDRKLYDVVVESIKPNSKDIAVKIDKHFYAIPPKHPELWGFTFSDVIELKTAVSELEGFELLAELARVVYGTSNDSMQRVEFFSLKNISWVNKALEEMLLIEASEFEGADNGVDMSALARFGHTPAVDSIAGGDPLKHKAVLGLTYGKVFEHMCLQQAIGKIKEAIQKKHLTK